MAAVIINVPDDLAPFAVDLEYFVETMVRKLHVNRHKGTSTVPLDVLQNGLNAEVEELFNAISKESQFDVGLEACDVANFAFLIALRAWSLDKQQFERDRTL